MQSRRCQIYFGVIALWVIVTGVALCARTLAGPPGYDYLAALTAATIYLVVLVGWGSLKSVQALLTSLPVIHRIIMITLVALTLFAQIGGSAGYLYPFVSWTLFSTPPGGDTVRYHEFTGVKANGDRERIRLARVIPSLARGRIVGEIDRLFKALNENPTDKAKARLHETLQGLARAYNHNHRDDPIQAMEVHYRWFRINDYTDESSIHRRLVWRVTLPEAGR